MNRAAIPVGERELVLRFGRAIKEKLGLRREPRCRNFYVRLNERKADVREPKESSRDLLRRIEIGRRRAT